MPITVSGTTITFNDSTTQTTAPVAGASGGQFAQVFTSSGTFTIPTGVTGLYVQVVGGGGGGGGNSGQDAIAGSGGNGGYTRQWFTGLTAGNTLTITVGGAGTAGSSTGAGGTGGTSSIASGTQTVTTCNATGGTGGGPATSGGDGANGSGGGGTTTFLNSSIASPNTINPFVNYGLGGAGRGSFSTGSGNAGNAGIVVINY